MGSKTKVPAIVTSLEESVKIEFPNSGASSITLENREINNEDNEFSAYRFSPIGSYYYVHELRTLRDELNKLLGETRTETAVKSNIKIDKNEVSVGDIKFEF